MPRPSGFLVYKMLMCNCIYISFTNFWNIDHIIQYDSFLGLMRQYVTQRNCLYYLSEAENEASEAPMMIQTVRLRKFKGTTSEMYLIQVMLAHSMKLERMIIEQCKRTNATYGYQPKQCKRSNSKNGNQFFMKLVSYP